MDTEVFENLKKAILEYDKDLAANSAREVVEQKIDTLKAVEVMTDTIKQVGDAYGKGELWLPDLVGAGDAMSSAMKILDEVIKKEGKKREHLGSVVIGTVYGDIHSIGKDMVSTLLTAEGFEVHDLGTNVSPDDFINAIKEYNADLIAMSALLTVTAPEQRTTIEALKKASLREKVKVMVGGAATTQDFADSIGADGFAPTAPGGVKLARQLLNK